jgi:hypothetical protein
VDRPADHAQVDRGDVTISQAAVGTIGADFARLREALARQVPHSILSLPPARSRDLMARAREALADAGTDVQPPSLLLVVDRNPKAQLLVIVLARPDQTWQVLGADRVSTGQSGRHGYFITPTGVFLHTDAILDYRAEGTFNEHHIRGLGLKGSRVWDFGWVSAIKGWRVDQEVGQIRLLLHATDPDFLEQRLGRPASKGCIRISAAMNAFLDKYGVLDADYEVAAAEDPGFRALLRPDRTPTHLTGHTLMIVDSSAPRGSEAAGQKFQTIWREPLY